MLRSWSGRQQYYPSSCLFSSKVKDASNNIKIYEEVYAYKYQQSLNDVFMTVSVRKEEYATDLENSAATNIPPIVRTSYKPSNAFMKNTKKV